ncbi:MAG: 30S ribosomal protein S6 [Candidatus Hydrogenedentes bacterium]|nr:30S ribosomal protein S6 [Candidatus Hydrogenedentota bacterium]
MRTYEALYICTPELEEGDIQTVSQEVDNLVTSNGGSIVRSEIWGKRKLAYMVKKYSEGTYILARFQAPPDFVKKLEQWFKLSDSVFRYMVVHFDDHMLRIEAEQARRKEEDLRKSAEATARGEEREDSDRPRRAASSYDRD